MMSLKLKIEKPWGYELLLTPPDAPVVAKILHINKGSRFSLQYHEIKRETLILIRGEAKIIYGDNENNLNTEIMKIDNGYYINNNVIHRCEAVTDCDIFESSTPEVGKTVRIEDDYKRGNEGEEERIKDRLI